MPLNKQTNLYSLLCIFSFSLSASFYLLWFRLSHYIYIYIYIVIDTSLKKQVISTIRSEYSWE